MTRRLWTAFKLDSLFQFRSGLHLIYVVLSLIYVVVINQIPLVYGDIVVPFMIFSDPAVLGFFFIGGLVMLEKNQGVIDLIVVTPVRSYEYLLGKVIALNAISVLASFAIALFTQRSFNGVYLFLSVLLTGSFFTMCGFLLALTSKSMNHYFGRVIPAMLLIIAPCFTLIGFPYSEVFYIVPGVASAKLIFGAFHQTPLLSMGICLMIMCLWNVIIFKHIMKRFASYSVSGGGNSD